MEGKIDEGEKEREEILFTIVFCLFVCLMLLEFVCCFYYNSFGYCFQKQCKHDETGQQKSINKEKMKEKQKK